MSTIGRADAAAVQQLIRIFIAKGAVLVSRDPINREIMTRTSGGRAGGWGASTAKSADPTALRKGSRQLLTNAPCEGSRVRPATLVATKDGTLASMLAHSTTGGRAGGWAGGRVVRLKLIEGLDFLVFGRCLWTARLVNGSFGLVCLCVDHW